MVTLVEEATRRSGVLWLVVGELRPQLLWHAWHAGAALVVHGGPEQPLSGVADGSRVLVVIRSHAMQADRVVQWWALVERLDPATAAWQDALPVLAARRLNAADGASRPARWATESTVLRLVPSGAEPAVERGEVPG